MLVICPENGYRELDWKSFEEWGFMSGKWGPGRGVCAELPSVPGTVQHTRQSQLTALLLLLSH